MKSPSRFTSHRLSKTKKMYLISEKDRGKIRLKGLGLKFFVKKLKELATKS